MRLLIGIHAMEMTVLSVFFSAFATVAFRTLDWKLITKVSAAFGKLSNALSPQLSVALSMSFTLSLSLFLSSFLSCLMSRCLKVCSVSGQGSVASPMSP